MTTKKILFGIEFRLKSLKKAFKSVSKSKLVYVARDFETRIDELESLTQWIKRNGK